jgi:thiosulfate/3-mercaptopyruvate sulfurtransferase
MSDYAYPQSLVTTQWVADHLHDSNVRLLEVGWDKSEFEGGHIPGTVAAWGYTDLHRASEREIPSKSEIESMLSQAGIANNDTIVLYGGFANLAAAMAFWVLNIYGHPDVRLLDGGRQKWLAEHRPLSTDIPSPEPTQYVAQKPDTKLRAERELVADAIGRADCVLVDARPEDMYTGEYKAGTAHAGHIPTAINIPATRILDSQGEFLSWQTPTTNSDGTFKPVEELTLLFSAMGISPEKKVITYCLRGGLSTHMWFVLTKLLRYPHAIEYDRSWIEWGNLEDMPAEK